VAVMGVDVAHNDRCSSFIPLPRVKYPVLFSDLLKVCSNYQIRAKTCPELVTKWNPFVIFFLKHQGVSFQVHSFLEHKNMQTSNS